MRDAVLKIHWPTCETANFIVYVGLCCPRRRYFFLYLLSRHQCLFYLLSYVSICIFMSSGLSVLFCVLLGLYVCCSLFCFFFTFIVERGNWFLNLSLDIDKRKSYHPFNVKVVIIVWKLYNKHKSFFVWLKDGLLTIKDLI